MRLLFAVLAVVVWNSANAEVPAGYTFPDVSALPVSNENIRLLFSSENSIWDTNPSLDQALAQVARVAWLEARKFPSGLDRAYLIALAIDYYNSLGPESNVCPPRQLDEYDNPEQQRCGKEEIWYKYIHPGLRHDKVVEEFKQYWSKDDPQYWWYYFITQVEISGPNDPPVIDARNRDAANPTHYAELKRWLDDTAALREKGIPPWEAMEYFDPAAAGATEATARETTSATAVQPNAQTPPTPRPQAQQPSDNKAVTPERDAPTEGTRWGAVAVAVVLLVLAAAWLLRRRTTP